MRKITCLGFALASLLCSSPAFADVNCSGTVIDSYVTIDGAVIIRGSWRNDFTQICNITSSWNNVPIDVCALWVAKIDAAISTNHTIDVYYYGSLTCATIPYYNTAPAPYYVMLNS